MRYEQDDAPTLEELFPEGERVVITYPHGRKRLAAGSVVGYTAGLYDHGTPDSGPGPLAVEALLLVACDDGRTRRAYPGDVEPEDLA
jgi:hypothetical protein